MFSDDHLDQIDKAFREGLPDASGKSQLGILLIHELRKTKTLLEAASFDNTDENAFGSCICKNSEQVVQFSLTADGTFKLQTYKTNDKNIIKRIINAFYHIFRKEDLDHCNTVFLKYDSIEKINKLTTDAIEIIEDSRNIHKHIF